MMATPSAQDCVTSYGLPSRGGLIRMFVSVSSADMNLLLPIAPELRLAPLHALHDTSNESSATCGNWGKSERAPHKRYSNACNNWGEPERAPHRRETHARIVYIYICMYGTTVTRGAAHTQYTVRIPKYSAQYRPHVVMFASSTAQACNIHCHVFKHRSSYVCALVLMHLSMKCPTSPLPGQVGNLPIGGN